MFGTDAVKAGSPWGAATFAGATGARQPTDIELAYARHQVRAVLGCWVCVQQPAGPTLSLLH